MKRKNANPHTTPKGVENDPDENDVSPSSSILLPQEKEARHRPEAGAEVRVEVRIDADFPGESFERTPGHIQLFEIISGGNLNDRRNQ